MMAPLDPVMNVRYRPVSEHFYADTTRMIICISEDRGLPSGWRAVSGLYGLPPVPAYSAKADNGTLWTI